MFKKTLVAVAVLGAAAFSAQAANVTMYGKIDTGLRYTNVDADVVGQDDVSTFEMKSGNYSGSRFGLKGSEDLGNGLSVGFVLENGFDSDDGTFDSNGDDKLFGRQASLHLKGNFGEFAMGRMGALSSTAGTFGLAGALSPLGTGWGDVGNQNLVFGGAEMSSRRSNMVTYVTPDFAGLKVYAQYGMGEKTENKSSDDRYYALGVTYQMAALSTLAIAESVNRESVSNANADDSYRFLLGGSYDLGVVKPYVAASYFKDGKVADLLGSWAVDADHKANLDRHYDGYGITVGASMPLGAGKAHAVVGYMDAEYSAEANSTVVNGRSIDVTRFIVGTGYEYPLSKRTTVYADLGYFKDDVDAANNKYDYKPEGYQAAVGLCHSF